MGIVTTTSARRGADEEPLVLPNAGVELREPRPGREELEEVEEEPAKVLERWRRASKSEPVGPRDLATSMVMGRCRFEEDRRSKSGPEGRRFTS